MKSAPTTIRSESALDKPDSITKCAEKLVKRIKRHSPTKRIVEALLERGYLWRTEVNIIAGLSNSPDEIMRIRASVGRKNILCHRVRIPTLDGRFTQAGQYSLSPEGKMIVRLALDQTKRCDKPAAGQFNAKDLV